MLADKDRIFTNLYGYQDFALKAAQKNLSKMAITPMVVAM